MDLDRLRALIERTDPAEPVPPDDPLHLHYDFDAHRLRGEPWRTALARVIRLAPGDKVTAQVAAGLNGSGKTTELHRLRDELVSTGHRVHLVSAGRWMPDDRPIQVSDLLLALVLAIHPTGDPASLGQRAARLSERIWAFLNAQVEIKKLIGDLGPLKAHVEVTANPDVYQRMARILAERTDLAQQVFSLVGEAASDARSEGLRLVIILDDIEKRALGMTGDGAVQETFRNHWFDAFLQHAQELRPPAHVIYIVPPFMVRRSQQIALRFDRELQFLPMVRIWKTPKAGGAALEPDRAGFAAMREALFMRVGADRFSEPAVAEWLIAHSGGFMRDLLRMTQECIFTLDDRQPLIDRSVADRAIERIRQTYFDGILGVDVSMLRAVGNNPRYQAPDEAHERRFAQLLVDHTVMRYHNAHTWHAVHPLLWHPEVLGVEGPRWHDLPSA